MYSITIEEEYIVEEKDHERLGTNLFFEKEGQIETHTIIVKDEDLLQFIDRFSDGNMFIGKYIKPSDRKKDDKRQFQTFIILQSSGESVGYIISENCRIFIVNSNGKTVFSRMPY